MLLPPMLLLDSFVVFVMLSIGLRVTGHEVLEVLHNRALLVRALVANCVLIPGIGWLLVNMLPLPPDASVGILLLAAIPGTPIALQFNRKVKTRLAFAALMTFALSLVSILLTPLAVEVMPRIVQRSERPIWNLIVSVLLYIATPLCTGLWVGRSVPRIAPRLILPLEILATVVFAFLMLETRLARRAALVAIAGHETILAMFLLLVISMLIGWFVPTRVVDRHRHAQCDRGALCSALLFSWNQCLHGPNCLSIFDGSHQSALSSSLRGMAQTAACADGHAVAVGFDSRSIPRAMMHCRRDSIPFTRILIEPIRL